MGDGVPDGRTRSAGPLLGTSGGGTEQNTDKTVRSSKECETKSDLGKPQDPFSPYYFGKP